MKSLLLLTALALAQEPHDINTPPQEIYFMAPTSLLIAPGVVHNDNQGNLYSSLVFVADMDPSGTTTASTANTLVLRDGSARISASAALAAFGSAAAPAFGFASSANTGLYAPAAGQFSLAANGTDKLKFDGNSILESSTYKLRGYNPSTQTIPAAGTLIVTCTTKSFDPQNSLTTTGTSAGTFVAPVTGIYMINMNVPVTGTVALQTITLTLTNSLGVPYAGYRMASELNFVALGLFNTLFSWATTLSLTAGATVQLRASNSSASAPATIQANAEINIHLLSVS